MKLTTITFLLGLPLLFANVTTLESATTKVSDSSISGITVSLLNHENDALTNRITLAATNHFTITVTDVPQDIWFIVLQIHTFQYNVTLAYDKRALNKESDRSLFGSNIGLYLKTHNVTDPIQVFLMHDNTHDIEGLLVIVPYSRNAPIPGGCNMEFDIEIAPYQKLHAGNEIITVDTQPGSVLAANGSLLSCEKQLVQHRMYRLYLTRQDFTPDTYFEAIASMVTPQDIVRNGDKIPSSAYGTSMRHFYSAYTGVGSVYAAVATYGNYSSAYVPTFTYACSPLSSKSCQVLNDTFPKVICWLALIIGFVLVFGGHNCVPIDRWLPILIISSFFWYTFAVVISNLSITINLLIALIMVSCTIVLSMILGYFKKFPVISFTYNLPMGLLCACVTYLYAPAEWFYIMENDELFWLLFVSIMLTVSVLLSINRSVANVIKYTVYESLFVILAIDYFAESSLKYIFITTMRRILVSGFRSAFVYPPYQGAEKALVIFWFLLMIIRFITKFCHGGDEANPERAPLLPFTLRKMPTQPSIIVVKRLNVFTKLRYNRS